MNYKISIPVNNNVLDAHFGHAKEFAIFTIEENEIISQETMIAPPHEPGLLPKILSEKGITNIIAGGMGQKAIQLFNKAGVNVFVGAPQLESIQLIRGFLNKTIQYTANYCDH